VSALAGLAAAVGVAGLLLVGWACYGGQVPAGAPPSGIQARVRRSRGRRRADRRTLGLAAAAIVVGAAGWLLTSWPVVGLAAAAATIGLPQLLGSGDARSGSGAARIERLDALEQFTRRLSDVLVVGSGIEHALVASAARAPAPIAAEVAALAARLRARQPTEVALRAFADDLDDPAGDLVAAALILSARRRGRGLAAVLEGLAGAVDEEVGVRRGVEADRAKPRTTARAVTVIAVSAVVLLGVADRAYAAPFASPAGQLVLAAVCVLFAFAFYWLHRLADVGAGGRFLPKPTEFKKTDAAAMAGGAR
jgi:Flp pilus assembly protein TadB